MGSSGEIDIAAYTGSTTLDYANHITGPNYAIQGNILIGPEVLSGMEDGFLNTPGSLAEKLMGAMQGAKIPGADARCLAEGLSSRSSFLRVLPAEGDAGRLDIIVPSTVNNVDPIDSLQTLFTQRFQTTSVRIVEPNTILKLSPNPAVSGITFQHMESVFEQGSVYFYTSNGVLLQQNDLLKDPIDIGTLPEGLVFYQAYSKDGLSTTSGKIIIKNKK